MNNLKGRPKFVLWLCATYYQFMWRSRSIGKKQARAILLSRRGSQNGLGLVQVLVAAALVALLSLVVAKMFGQSFKTKSQFDKSIRASQLEMDLALLTTAIDQCSCAIKSKSLDTTNLATAEITLSALSMYQDKNCLTKAFDLASTSASASPELRVTSIRVKDIVPYGANSYMGRFVVSPEVVNQDMALKDRKSPLFIFGTSGSTGTVTVSGCLAPDTPSSNYIYFGGMYGFGNGITYTNHLTGAASCPAGYAAYGFRGRISDAGFPPGDWAAVVCFREKNAPGPMPTQFSDFGGMYGSHGGGTYPNPATGTTSCPSGYTVRQVIGTTNSDYPIYYCWRSATNPELTSLYQFGGIFGTTDVLNYDNPLTGVQTCPTGFVGAGVNGTVNIDWPTGWCYK
jgi:hypothetical protein